MKPTISAAPRRAMLLSAIGSAGKAGRGKAAEAAAQASLALVEPRCPMTVLPVATTG